MLGKYHGWSMTLICIIAITIAGCAGLLTGKKARKTSSVVSFLYPGRSDVVVKPTVPKLTLPLNVGIAFVPSSGAGYANQGLDPAFKQKLMERVAGEFSKLKFIKNIELIPTAYLRPGGSFSNLDQIKTMYGVNVIVLLSYDQERYTDEGLVSLTYWTIVGAYIFRGEKNDTSTMIDAAVYDIPSRKMLFRAPGVSQVKGSATLVNQSEALRKDSHKGFELAADNLVVNLKNELDRFKQKIKKHPEQAQIVYSRGYRGGGYFGAGLAAVLFLLLGMARWHGRRREEG